jgi:UDP-3-O-[3-hydroxymyristoyl] N-acetylglucosamine deacetylase/UDP-3-O-[3-hydroxymyristoyl] N-acetylglucosamine deacetylase/3-hydroxyacyl-[acyl-carrier-protein] dehydratase
LSCGRLRQKPTALTSIDESPWGAPASVALSDFRFARSGEQSDSQNTFLGRFPVERGRNGPFFSGIEVMDEKRLSGTTRMQHTIATEATVEGFGYWTGKDVRVIFEPSFPNTGIVFVREDLPGEPEIPAQVRYRVEKPRQTALKNGPAGVHMIEHVMATLCGLEIDNCRVRVNRPEMPGCDGSSFAFMKALLAARILPQPITRERRVIRRPVRVGDDSRWIEATPSPQGETVFRYRLEYDAAHPIESQSFECVLSPSEFRKQLACARTYVTREEADMLRSHGLGTRATAKDVLVFDHGGPIDNALHFPNECARHKVLDMIGDLSLGGCDWVGEFTGYRSGHQLNAELLRQLLQDDESKAPKAVCRSIA